MRPVIALALALTVTLAAQSPTQPILGFKDPAKQRALEGKLDAQLNRDNLRNWMKRLSARPHHVGSPYGKEHGEYMAALFKSAGFKTSIERSAVHYSTW